MKTQKMIVVVAVLIALAVGSSVAYAQGTLTRLRADRLSHGDEIATASEVPGLTFYNEVFLLGKGRRTIFITFTASGDTHDGAQLLMRGEIDGRACTGKPGASAAAPGWQALSKLPDSGSNCNDGGGGGGDCHDNSIVYTCCRNIRTLAPGPHTVTLKMARGSSPHPAGTVFFENAHVYIDSTRNRSRSLCRDLPAPG